MIESILVGFGLVFIVALVLFFSFRPVRRNKGSKKTHPSSHAGPDL